MLSTEFDRLERVLAAYNAGEEAVKRYGREVPPFPETQQYVSRLQKLKDQRAGLTEQAD